MQAPHFRVPTGIGIVPTPTPLIRDTCAIKTHIPANGSDIHSRQLTKRRASPEGRVFI